jgi:molybdopterin-containing oxidoreductase family iron-sulfur binding subunit
MDGFDFVREVSVEHPALQPPPAQPSLYPARASSKNAWGMVIDLDLCIGCNACVTACVAENNIAMVGKEQVAKGREMHWLRVDRYYEGSADDPRHAFQPVPCMHCEDAPCEMGCPVNATVHSPDGLNLQVYNRCIGTRTCSAYCPYKVRRFNWFDFTGKDSPELQAARNPEVTVRGRGVMEKCTYCIQRLQNARIDAEVAGDFDWAAGVQTACQQACPTQAIIFGDLSDPDSPVSRRKRNGRDYSLLEEANTRPRTTYSARIAGGEQES